MPGKNFKLRTSPYQTAAIADAAVDDLARRLTQRLLGESSPRWASGELPEALALLHVLNHLHQATERLQREAATAAARAGASYPQLGSACGMTRQGARRRWPGLFHHSDETPRSTR